MRAAFERMRLAAKRDRDLVWNNLMHQMNEAHLERAYRAQDGKKAPGADGMSKARYGEGLQANLVRLVSQLHRGSWRPRPSRRVEIPKADGKVRPLAISCFEDKVVQKAMADILVVIYEPIFSESSHGFRPKRGAHTAVKRLYRWLEGRARSFVVDIDIERFFDTIDHEKLMEVLRKRISDRRFLRLIGRMLKAEVLTAEGVRVNDAGAPQGSIISPVLANIYLHEVVDQWVEERYGARPHMMVRYADDMVIGFGSRRDATECLQALGARLEAYGLRLHPDKSRVVEFGRGGHEMVHFLGFKWYWGRNRKRQPLLKLKTQAERFRRAIAAFVQWIKEYRCRKSLKALWEEAGAKLRGHYAYYGVTGNQRLFAFYWAACQALFKWLNRRSQRWSFSREAFKRRLALHPLPKPWGCTCVDIAQRELRYAV